MEWHPDALADARPVLGIDALKLEMQLKFLRL